MSYAHNIDKLKIGLDHHIYEPTQKELDAITAECAAWDENRSVQGLPYEPNMFGVNQLYPSLARDTSAGILGIIARASQSGSEDDTEGSSGTKPKKIPVFLDLEFANDTLFCEWAYVIDLDKEILEIYSGGERKHDGHRFKDVGSEDAPVPAFICSLRFSELYLMKGAEEFKEKVNEAIEGRSKAEGSSNVVDEQGVL